MNNAFAGRFRYSTRKQRTAQCRPSRRIGRGLEPQPLARRARAGARHPDLHQFRGDAQFYTWLYRIAVNTAKKTLLDLKRHPSAAASPGAGGEEEDETSWRENEPSTRETPESEFAAREIALAVNAAMDALSEDLRQAVTLREIEGLSYEEIAEAMDCPIGTVRSRIFRAREAISARVRPMLEHQSGKRW